MRDGTCGRLSLAIDGATPGWTHRGNLLRLLWARHIFRCLALVVHWCLLIGCHTQSLGAAIHQPHSVRAKATWAGRRGEEWIGETEESGRIPCRSRWRCFYLSLEWKRGAAHHFRR